MNNSSGASVPEVWRDTERGVPRGGQGEVGARKPCKGDSCGEKLEGRCSGEDDDEGEESGTAMSGHCE